jgi:hypothetical protein
MSHDDSKRQYSGNNNASSASSTRDVERRRAGRHIFTAAAEVVDLDSGARFSTRTTDLGPGGCFVDTMVPFPVGSKVRVSVRKGKTQFEADGTVVYSQVGLGMGIGFDALDPSQREALDIWLSELTAGRQSSHRESERRPHNPMVVGSMANQAAVVRLVQLLIGKGLLTEAEGASILYDPVL